MLRPAFPTVGLRCVVATLLLCGAALASRGARATPAAPASESQLTALVAAVPSPPRWFAGSDGRVHLAYELWLTNPLPAPVTLTSVEVLAADDGTTLMELDGELLLAATSLAASPEEPTVRLPPAAVGVVWLDVPLADEDAIPVSVAHRLSVELPPDVPVDPSLLSFTGASAAVDRRPPVVLGPPLAGSRWAALGSCCDGPHRRALYPIDGRWFLGQRFAIDFNQLEPDNRPGAGDPYLSTSFPHFGAPVLAVADAAVVEAVDRYPDLNPGQAREEVTPQNAGGNHVVLDLGDGRFAVYAHLQAGSVAVRAGDRVERGQRIASVGSSGTTGGPHLHFQVTDRPSVVVAEGLPYVFDAFEVTGRTPPLAEVVPYYDTLEPIPLSAEGAGPRTNALPLGRDVVAFPPTGGDG